MRMEQQELVFDMVDAVLQGETAFAQEKFQDIISARVGERLTDKKAEIAQSLYKGQSEE